VEQNDLTNSSMRTVFVNKTMPTVPMNLLISECLYSVLFPFCQYNN